MSKLDYELFFLQRIESLRDYLEEAVERKTDYLMLRLVKDTLTLNENILGDISPKPIPQSIQAKFVLIKISCWSITSTKINPSANFSAVSTESDNLFSIPSLTMILSTIAYRRKENSI